VCAWARQRERCRQKWKRHLIRTHASNGGGGGGGGGGDRM